MDKDTRRNIGIAYAGVGCDTRIRERGSDARAHRRRVGAPCLALFYTLCYLQHCGAFVLAVILTSVVFSLGGLINGVFAKGFDGISIVPTFVLTPLTYLGGIFYSIQQFSPFWQKVCSLTRYSTWSMPSAMAFWACQILR